MSDAWRRPLSVAMWVGATAVATLVSSRAVDVVTARVIGPTAVALPAASNASASATDQLVLDAIVEPPVSTNTPSVASVPPPSTPPRRAAPATTSVPPTVLSTTSSSTTTAPPERSGDSSGTFSTEGGVVTVACDRFAIRLVSARPNGGYGLQVRESGPRRVDVEFRSDQERYELVLVCRDGQPTQVDDDGRDRRGR